MNAEPRAASRRGVVFRGNTRSVEDDDARVDGRTDDNHHASTSGRRRGRRRETCHTSSITRGSTEFARTRPRGPVGVAALPSLAYFSLYSSSNQFFHSRTNARSLAFNLRVRRVRINPFHRYHNARQLWKSAQSSPPPAFDAGGSSNVAHPPPASSAGGGGGGGGGVTLMLAGDGAAPIPAPAVGDRIIPATRFSMCGGNPPGGGASTGIGAPGGGGAIVAVAAAPPATLFACGSRPTSFDDTLMLIVPFKE